MASIGPQFFDQFMMIVMVVVLGMIMNKSRGFPKELGKECETDQYLTELRHEQQAKPNPPRVRPHAIVLGVVRWTIGIHIGIYRSTGTSRIDDILAAQINGAEQDGHNSRQADQALEYGKDHQFNFNQIFQMSRSWLRFRNGPLARPRVDLVFQ